MKQRIGNVLGNPRAEADGLLDSTFLQTADYQALISTDDFHVVVGRRGTGKSALFKKIGEHFSSRKKTLLHQEKVEEHHSLSLHRLLSKHAPDYRSAQAIMRIIWKAYCFQVVGRQLLAHYKLRGTEDARGLEAALRETPNTSSAYGYGVALLKLVNFDADDSVPAQVASHSQLVSLQTVVSEALDKHGMNAVILLDNLDEGWVPEPVSTALVGGLIRSASDLADAQVPIHALAFVRDNMFRALAELDPDFSRHVEGSSLRLRWDEESLLSFIAKRIRAAFNISGDNNIRAWNRFADRNLQNRDGFAACLQNTLYRPRDALALLNRAHQTAARAERNQIIDTDIDAAALTISSERLSDLAKEYHDVFPGLRLFINVFRGSKALWSFDELINYLEGVLEEQTYDVAAAQDFAVLNSGFEIFLALYSVGFFGVRAEGETSFVFCHDGATSEMHDSSTVSAVALHPCYWRALGVTEEGVRVELLSSAHDEGIPRTDETSLLDQRMRRLGQTVESLPRLQPGKEHAEQFEEWVERAIRILFSGDLGNIQLHPNPDGASRRDVVATVHAEKGFWKRVLTDYGTRLVAFEVKNYAELKPDDFRQALAYTGNEYGKLVFIVYQAENEQANENERRHLQEIYKQHSVIIVLFPAKLLSRFVAKMRSGPRPDYWQQRMGKLLDAHLRSYLHVLAGRRKPKRRRNRATS